MSIEHDTLSGASTAHGIPRWLPAVVPTQAARYGLTVTSADIGKVALQGDNKRFYALIDHTNVGNSNGWRELGDLAALVAAAAAQSAADAAQSTADSKASTDYVDTAVSEAEEDTLAAAQELHRTARVTDITFADSPYTATATNEIIRTDTTDGSIVIVLPDQSTRRRLVVENIVGTANQITLQRFTGTDTINGNASDYTFDASGPRAIVLSSDSTGYSAYEWSGPGDLDDLQQLANSASEAANAAQSTADGAATAASDAQSDIDTHVADLANPHAVTATQVGLGSVVNAGFGSTSGTYCEGNDARLSDARTPTAHATSHKSGGSDAIALNELAVPTAAVNFNSQKLTSVADPTVNTDGVNLKTLRTARVTNPGAYPYTILNTDELVQVTTSSARTLNLPNPTGGGLFLIKDVSGSAQTNNITLARFASETIEGAAANYTLGIDGGSWLVWSDGTNWHVSGGSAPIPINLTGSATGDVTNLNGHNLLTTASIYAGTTTTDSEQAGSVIAVGTGSTSRRGFVSYQFSTDTNAGRLYTAKARGTRASPSAIANADNVGRWVAAGWSGSSWIEAGQILFVVDGTVSGSAVPIALELYTGSTSSPTKRLSISSAGVVDWQALELKDIGAATADTSAARWDQVKTRINTGRPIGPGSYPYTVLGTDETILVNTSSARTINLPNPAGDGTNFPRVEIIDIIGSANTNNITVARYGSETIRGTAANATLSIPFGAWMFISDGTNWHVSGYI